MNDASTPAFSSPSSESHPGSAGTPDVSTPAAELQQAIEEARAAEAHVLELMHQKDIGTPGNPPDTQAPSSAGDIEIQISRPSDRDVLLITAGDHSVCVPMRAIRDRLTAEGEDASTHIGTADLLELAPYILEHPELFEAIGEYSTAPSAAE